MNKNSSLNLPNPNDLPDVEAVRAWAIDMMAQTDPQLDSSQLEINGWAAILGEQLQIYRENRWDMWRYHNVARLIQLASYPEHSFRTIWDKPGRHWRELPDGQQNGRNIIRLPEPLLHPTLVRIVELNGWEESVRYILRELDPKFQAEVLAAHAETDKRNAERLREREEAIDRALAASKFRRAERRQKYGY